jgi:hypothetical protein
VPGAAALCGTVFRPMLRKRYTFCARDFFMPLRARAAGAPSAAGGRDCAAVFNFCDQTFRQFTGEQRSGTPASGASSLRSSSSSQCEVTSSDVVATVAVSLMVEPGITHL